MRLLALICFITLPTLSFSQFIVNRSTNDVSQLLSTQAVDDALNDSYATENNISNKITPSIFNLGIVSRFDFVGINPIEIYDIFNVTSLEFYFTVASRLRLVAMARFSTPVSRSDSSFSIQDSIYKQRLGWGAGLVAILNDARNNKGVGLVSTMNFVVAGDYSINNNNVIFGSSDPLYKLELGFRFNRFMAKNFAFVFGLDFGGGILLTRSKSLISYAQGSNEYRDDFYTDFPDIIENDYKSWTFNIGATIGFMF